MTWANLVSAVAGLLSRILDAWQRERDRQAGRDQQKVADLEKNREAERERRKVDQVVSAAHVAERQRMLDRWTRR